MISRLPALAGSADATPPHVMSICPLRSIFGTTVLLALGSVLLVCAMLQPGQVRAGSLLANGSAETGERHGNELPPMGLPQLEDVTASTGITFNHLSSPEQK
jgi:hypothetical protein